MHMLCVVVWVIGDHLGLYVVVDLQPPPMVTPDLSRLWHTATDITCQLAEENKKLGC